jgi:hypothetical protein
MHRSRLFDRTSKDEDWWKRIFNVDACVVVTVSLIEDPRYGSIAFIRLSTVGFGSNKLEFHIHGSFCQTIIIEFSLY